MECLKLEALNTRCALAHSSPLARESFHNGPDEYNSEHDTIYFTDQLFENTLKSSFIRSLSFFLPGGNHVILLDKEHREKTRILFETLKQFNNDADVVPGIIYALLKLVIKCHGLQSPDRPATSSKEQVVGDFKALVAKKFPGTKGCFFLCFSIKHHAEVPQSGITFRNRQNRLALILEHVLLEAKSLLRQTPMTVLEICNWLGYSDHSYFTKAFKKSEGVLPSSTATFKRSVRR